MLGAICRSGVTIEVNFRPFLAAFAFSALAGFNVNGQPAVENRSLRCGTDVIARRVYKEYGAVFATSANSRLPSSCFFTSEKEVSDFQARLDTASANVGGVKIELQKSAMEALIKAVAEAETRGIRITPLDGAIAGKRRFSDTVRIWNSRFLPGLDHWVARRKISREDADRAKGLPLVEQLETVFVWESRGYYFSTGKNKPIMSSVAPPGTSQHLLMLAFDIEQAGDPAARRILNSYGWYQTVVGDSPHFTYLGRPENELPGAGLKKVASGGYSYWVPGDGSE